MRIHISGLRNPPQQGHKPTESSPSVSSRFARLISHFFECKSSSKKNLANAVWAEEPLSDTVRGEDLLPEERVVNALAAILKSFKESPSQPKEAVLSSNSESDYRKRQYEASESFKTQFPPETKLGWYFGRLPASYLDELNEDVPSSPDVASPRPPEEGELESVRSYVASPRPPEEVESVRSNITSPRAPVEEDVLPPADEAPGSARSSS
jgi:hypothetical protein